MSGFVRAALYELCNACFHLNVQRLPDRIVSPIECDGLHFNL